MADGYNEKCYLRQFNAHGSYVLKKKREKCFLSRAMFNVHCTTFSTVSKNMMSAGKISLNTFELKQKQNKNKSKRIKKCYGDGI